MTANRNGSPVASQRIADELADRILTGKLLPGTRIIQDELADEFNASRIPVREALRMLHSRGLVTLRANSGAWVSKMSQRECELFYKVRERIEPLLLTESLPLITDEDVEALEAVQAAIERTDDIEEFLVLDRKFHWLTYRPEAAGQLATMIERLWDTTQHYRRAFTRLAGSQRGWVINSEHHLLIEAVRARDAEAAEAVLRLHIRRTRTELARHPELFEE